MISLDEDPILGRFFDTSEKKAKWLACIRVGYIIWIFFVVIGIMSLLIWYLLK